ncbi:MAG: 2-amino-4-hydroxy-6-hydroxymethyldihydropteridine diphosphokinase [Sphingomicrobium sp.]
MEDATGLYAIGIGSNRCDGGHGRPADVVAAAIARLDQEFGLFDSSPIVINPATGGAGRDFANAVAIVESLLPPLAMLASLKATERDFGRRNGKRWSARVLDLDILAWSGGNFRARELIIPHPRLAQRTFAVGLLASIAPSWRIAGATNAQHFATRLARRHPVR